MIFVCLDVYWVSKHTYSGFDQQDYTNRLSEMFGKKSDYEVEIGHPVTRDDYPIPGPWRNGSIKDFLKNVETGEVNTGSINDSQVTQKHYFFSFYNTCI